MVQCPYCEFQLEKKPKRKTKCPNCDKHIFVRQGKLLTEDDAKLQDWAGRVESLGLTQKHIFNAHEYRIEKFGTQAYVNDTIWGLLNALVLKHANKPQTLGQVYFEMVQVLRGEGKNTINLLRKIAKIELRELKSLSCRQVQVATCNDDFVCPACKSIAAKGPIDLEHALNELPIPNRCTSELGCRCWYLAYFPFLEE